MKCPNCKFEDFEGSKFCNECGIKLEIACPKCSKANQAGSKFCNDGRVILALPFFYRDAEKVFSRPVRSFPRKRESGLLNAFWTPAFAGVAAFWNFSASCYIIVWFGHLDKK